MVATIYKNVISRFLMKTTC